MRLYSFVFTKIDGPYLLTCGLGFPEPKIVTFIISAQSDGKIKLKILVII